MEAEEFMKLFDSQWFGSKEEIPSTAMLMFQKFDEKNLDKFQLRSSSERCIRVDMKPSAGSEGPNLQRTSSKIPEKSGNKKKCCMRERGRRGLRRSLSALEIEEVKGFMDLGFVFDENDKTPGLVSIIPGLQKWGKTGRDGGGTDGVICRPYRVKYEREKGAWKMPSTKNDITMKDHLRFWAHIVASNVK